MRTWTTIYNTNTLGSPSDTKQSVWDRPGIIADQAVVMSAFTDNFKRARLLATSALHSGDWLHALPLSTCGLRLDNEAVRVAVCLRLGTSLCKPHQCPLANRLMQEVCNCLSCKRGARRSIRHNDLNDIIYQALARASMPSILEPPWLSRTDGKRPDGLTLIPSQRGKSVTWDVTVTDTVAESYLYLTSVKVGGAAENATTRKKDKYVDLQQTYTFIPLAFETLGSINVKGVEFLQELGHRLADISIDNRHTSFLFQRIIYHADTLCVNFWARDSVLMTLQSRVKSITMKTVLFILVYTIKRRHIITMINFSIKNTKFVTSVHMHVRVNTHDNTRTHLHSTHLFRSRATLSYRLNG